MAEKILAKQLQKQRNRFKGSTLFQDKIVAKKLQREDERIKRMLAGLDAEDIPPPPIIGVPEGGLLEKKLKQKASDREAGLAYAMGRIRQQRAVERQPTVEAKLKKPTFQLAAPRPIGSVARPTIKANTPFTPQTSAPKTSAPKKKLPEGIKCRTRPRKDGSMYTNCYGGTDEKKKTEKKSNTNNKAMMESEKKPSRRKQSAPKKNAKTVPQQIARKELIRGRSYAADRARAELVGKPMAPPPKAGKVVLKRNVRAGAKGDVRAKAKTGGIEVAKGVAKKAWEKASREMEGDAVERAYGFALNRMSELGKKNDYTFKKDDPRVMVKTKEDVKAPRSRRGLKAGGTFRFVATGKRGGNQYLTFRPTGSGMTIGPIAKSNKNDEVIMTLANYQNLKDKFTIL